MSTITLENIAATTEPFMLDVGRHVVAVTGEFNNAAAVLERREPNAHLVEGDHVTRPGLPPINLWHPVLPPFAKPGEAEFTVAPNAAGNYRIAVYQVGSRVRIASGSMETVEIKSVKVPAGAPAEITYEPLPSDATAPAINVVIGAPPVE